MRIVVALGGNALLRRGQSPDAQGQIENVKRACEALAPLIAEHEVIITHGNGPQVGVLALQSANDPNLTAPYPFDTLGAQTQGMIGYWLLQALQNVLPGKQIAAVVNQTLVDENDPAFENPTKFVGEVYTETEALRFREERGWTMKADGPHYRRVVGSPTPQRVVETRLVLTLLRAGVVVVCAGGGGVPVVRDSDGMLRGVEAVIDKDLTASVLAEHLEADFLMILTDVPNVIQGYGTESATPIGNTTPACMRALGAPAGSMGPKIDAVCRFVERTGLAGAIGRLEEAASIINGTAGTVVTTSGEYRAANSRDLLGAAIM